MLPPAEQTKKDEQGKKELWNTVRSVLSSSRKGPPIKRLLRDEKVPMSYAQQRLWFLEQLKPGTCVNNIPVGFCVKGSLNLTALEQSLAEIVRRHEILRTTFEIIDDRAVQVVLADAGFKLLVIDLQEIPEDKRDDEAQRLTLEEAQQPFNLTEAPLLRVKLLCLAKEEYLLLVTMHHIVSDGWSFNVFFEELTVLYEAFSNKQPSPLLELPIQYSDFTIWQSEWLQGEILECQLSYWKQQLNASTPLLELPTDKPRTPVQTYQGTKQFLKLSKELSDSLKTLSQREGVTLFMTLLAAFNILLYRYTSQEEIIVGSPIAGRNRSETKKLIGCFVNTLALRTNLRDRPSFVELLTQVREVAINAYSHQDLPFEMLVKELQLKRDLSHTPLFQVMFAFQKTAMQSLHLSGLTLTPLDVHSGTARFDLTLELEETSEGISGWFEYNTDLFESATIARMAQHFQILLEGIVANPEQEISQLPILTEQERHQLLVEWNDTRSDYPQNQCIHQLFEAQVERSPNAVAVVFSEQQITYRELNTRANKIAHYLRSLGVEPKALVGIYVDRTLSMIAGLLGIMKAGATYVPLDPAYPQERIDFMLEDAQVSVLLTQQKYVEQSKHQVQVVYLDADWEAIALQKSHNPNTSVTPENPAYVIYTSGSTGIPKGVAITHRAVNRLLHNTNYINIESCDKIAQVSNASFDAATFEIWGALLHGAQLVVIEKNVLLSPQDFASYLQKYEISVLFLTTALFNQIVRAVPQAFRSVRHLLFGGEVVDPKCVKEVLNNGSPRRLVHVYGPTEGTTFSTWYLVQKVAEDTTTIPIGRPISNTQVYILDQNLQPVPIGVTGELYIGGDGLAQGYLNRFELTQEKFIPNPLSSESSSRLYKTGDVARYLSNGDIEFICRQDNQIKIRGFRIELGEIEAVLLQHPNVREIVVRVTQDVAQEKSIVAYVIPKHKDQTLTNADLRRYLTQKLPEYMIPKSFVFLDALPLTPNGKVDRSQLIPNQIRDQQETYVAPRDEVEFQLVKIWEKMLGVHPISVTDNFFDLGGHSLLAVRLMTQLQKIYHKNLPLTTIFQASTIEQMVSVLRQEKWSSPFSLLRAIKPNGSKPPLFCIHVLGKGFSYYRPLAKYLEPEQPLYGLAMLPNEPLRAIATEETEYISLSRTEDLASHYIKEMRILQPEGPYFLIGMSFGGLVAFEMATQLIAEGHKVSLLALLDTYVSKAVQILPDPERFSAHWNLFLETGPVYIWNKGKKVITDKLKDIFLKTAYKFYQTTKNPLPKYLQDYLFEINSRHALEDYIPTAYPGRVILFKAKEPEIAAGVSIDPLLGWGKVVTGELEVYEIPGSHLGMVQEPHVQMLAEKLNACLSTASISSTQEQQNG